MSLANGETSIHHKGKEVSTKDPPVEAVGGEASHFKSDHSKEEKGVATRVMGALLLSTRGMILTSISRWCLVTICLLHWAKCGFPFVVVIPKFLWAPMAFSIPNLDIHQGTVLPMPILFKLESGTSLG